MLLCTLCRRALAVSAEWNDAIMVVKSWLSFMINFVLYCE